MTRRPTLADIARHTGLSTATVSLALRGREDARIPPATVERVLLGARELGYVSDLTARSLRTGRSAALGLVSDEVTLTRFATAMIRGFLDEAEAREHAVMIMETGRQQARLDSAFEVLRARRIDAVAVAVMDSRAVPLPEALDATPRIVLNGTAPGTHGILPDGFAAGAAAVRHLLERGHRRIGLVGRHPSPPPPEVSVTIGARMDGIDAAMADAGLSFAAQWHGTLWEPELGFRGAHEILRRAPDVTAVLAANDRIAFGVYQALHERGLEVPADVSVMSFDDEELAALVRPGLTTMRLPYREIGALGAGRLLDALEGGDAPGPGCTLVPLELVERASVAAV